MKIPMLQDNLPEMKLFCATVVEMRPSSKPRPMPYTTENVSPDQERSARRTTHHDTKTNDTECKPPVERLPWGIGQCRLEHRGPDYFEVREHVTMVSFSLAYLD